MWFLKSMKDGSDIVWQTVEPLVEIFLRFCCAEFVFLGASLLHVYFALLFNDIFLSFRFLDSSFTLVTSEHDGLNLHPFDSSF